MVTVLLHGHEDQGIIGLPRPGCREAIASIPLSLK